MGGMTAQPRRNAPSKGGPKRRPKKGKADILGAWDHLQYWLGEHARLASVVKVHGRRQWDEKKGLWVANPEVGMLVAAAKEVRMSQKQYATLIGLPERGHEVSGVMSVEEFAEEGRLIRAERERKRVAALERERRKAEREKAEGGG